MNVFEQRPPVLRLPRVRITVKRLMEIVVIVAILLSLFSYLNIGPPRPRAWRLPDGTIVRLSIGDHNPPGRDSIKYLEVNRLNGDTRTYPFAIWHAGYDHPELRMDRDHSTIWFVNAYQAGRRYLGCSLNLKTGAFVDEGGNHPLNVGVDEGIVLEELPTTY